MMRPGLGLKLANGSSALMRHSMAWPCMALRLCLPENARRLKDAACTACTALAAMQQEAAQVQRQMSGGAASDVMNRSRKATTTAVAYFSILLDSIWIHAQAQLHGQGQAHLDLDVLLLEAQHLTLCGLDLLCYQVHSCDHLCHWVLHLQGCFLRTAYSGALLAVFCERAQLAGQSVQLHVVEQRDSSAFQA